MSIRNRVLVLALAAFASAPAHAVFIGNVQGGTDFPQGAVSFADAVVSYDPVVKNGEPTAPNRGASNSLGVPDYQSDANCDDAATCTFVSLGALSLRPRR